MDEPTVRRVANVFHLLWEQEQIGVKVSRLSEGSKGEVSAEFEVKTTLPGYESLVHGNTRYTLTSGRSMHDIGQTCQKRLDEIDWYALFEQLKVEVLGQYRQGEPPIYLNGSHMSQRSRFRVQPFLVEGQPNLFYGAGGSLKTFFALYLSTLMDLTILEHNSIKVEPGRVLYLDYETSPEEMDERANAVRNGLGEEVESTVAYRQCYQPLPSEIETIQEWVLERSIDLVVVDSMGGAIDGDMDKAQDVMEYFRALRSLNVTTLTLDHLNKEGKLIGSVYKTNASRCVWEMRRATTGNDSQVSVGLYHRKMNNGQLHQKPFGYEFTFDTDHATGATQAVSIRRTDVMDIPILASGSPIRLQIAAALKDGSLTAVEIAETLGIKHDVVRVALNRERGRMFTSWVDDSKSVRWGIATTAK